jgi:hypothetical protein
VELEPGSVGFSGVIPFRRDFRQGRLINDEVEFESWRRGFVDSEGDLLDFWNGLRCVFGSCREEGEE